VPLACLSIPPECTDSAGRLIKKQPVVGSQRAKKEGKNNLPPPLAILDEPGFTQSLPYLFLLYIQF
jgi:hypothetical protein